jgi:hypothetical protein
MPPTHLFEQMAVLDTRARAAAMRRDVAKTKRYLAMIEKIAGELRPFMVATQPEQAVRKIDESRTQAQSARLARAGGNDAALIDVLRRVAVEADRSLAGEGTASGILLHEEIADALLRLKRPADAMAEYELVVRRHPGRARSMLGAARAAAQAGNQVASHDWYRQLLKLWSEADENTEGLEEARKALNTAIQ